MTADLHTLRRAAAEVGREAGLRLVVLFGSVARGTPAAADLDIGVLGEGTADVVAVTNRFIQLLHEQAVDVTDLRRADPVLLAHTARDGTPLFEAQQGVFAEFASLAVRRFADTKKFRVAEREAIRGYVAGQGRRGDRA